LTNADLDHVLGLLLLREGESLHIHAPHAVRETLAKGLRLETILACFSGSNWHKPPLEGLLPLKTRGGRESGLSYRAIPLTNTQPLYFRESSEEGIQSVAYEIRDEQTGGKLLVAPDVASVTPDLMAAMQGADAIFFDGTFWSNDELQQIKGAPRTALDMGHLPIQTHSLKMLCGLPARHKILLHINNTNPILRPDSPERKEVEAAGITVGYDGLELEI
jgi:pyrroloquinoline quinone biosynthesis protein B